MHRIAPALLLFALVAATARAQYADVTSAGKPQSISALWRFHTGDDPAWATPSFDDSSWPLLKTTEFWSAQGYRGYYGYAWYRLQLKLPTTSEPLGIDIGHINSVAEVYADGRLIGTNGIMRPRPDWSMQLEANALAIPVSLNGHTVEIAVRVWKSPVASSYSGGGFHREPIVGSLALLEDARRIDLDNHLAGETSTLILDVLLITLGCGALGLFLLDRRNTEYAWFGLWAIGTALLSVWLISVVLRQGSVTLVDGGGELLAQPLYYCELLFFWGFLKARRGWLFWTTIAFDIVGATGNFLGYENAISLPAGRAILTGCYAVVFVLVIARVALSLRAGSRDARLLIVPICLFAAGNIVEDVRYLLFVAGLSHNGQPLTVWSNGVVVVGLNDIFLLLNLIAISFAILLRFTRTAKEEERLSAEMASAYQVQAQLVPLQLPATPHFRFESAFHAAGEVGGDFYQVFPQVDGGVLIAIGDVSGKGLKAAMLGTLVVGALRSLATEGLRPAEILARLSSQLAASSSGGFVTCCVADLTAGGRMTLANAGHLAPYRNGAELETNPGLPLGVVSSAAYSEVVISLDPGDQLTFLSDGVVEARNAQGELFGFERAAAVASEPAERIAAAAQEHGQEDDITVLTITLVGAPVHA